MTRRNMAQKFLVPVFALLTAFVFLTADLNTQAQNSNSSTVAETTSAQAGNTSGSAGTEHDLSGTYTGVIEAPALNLSGPATITFTNNTVSITTEGGGSASGRYTAREWPGQIAVSMNFSSGPTADIYSVRARRRGQWLWLTSVPGETKQFRFWPPSGGGGGRRRARRRAAQPTPEATPEATPAPPSLN